MSEHIKYMVQIEKKSRATVMDFIYISLVCCGNRSTGSFYFNDRQALWTSSIYKSSFSKNMYLLSQQTGIKGKQLTGFSDIKLKSFSFYIDQFYNNLSFPGAVSYFILQCLSYLELKSFSYCRLQRKMTNLAKHTNFSKRVCWKPIYL